MRRLFKRLNLFLIVWQFFVWPTQAEQENVLMIADFESYPNNLGGSVGVFGAAEPDWEKAEIPHSWYYGELTPNFSEKNVRRGGQSFMCANGFAKEKLRWATFSVGLGKLVDTEAIPIKIDSLDVQAYNYFIFWIKGEKGGEKVTVAFRDGHAINDLPQAMLDPITEGASLEWKKVIVPLAEIKEKIDLSQLDQVILEFGLNRGNLEGNIFYIDDLYFAKETTDEPQ